MASGRAAATAQEQIHEIIRAAGGRLTAPTRAVVDVLAASDRHLTAEDLNAEVAERLAGVAPSTIYRLLQRLDELGVVEHVHSGTGAAFYHLREQGHAHLICNGCGAIIDIPDAVLTPLCRTIEAQYGFSVEPHHAALLGRCGRCGLARHPADADHRGHAEHAGYGENGGHGENGDGGYGGHAGQPGHGGDGEHGHGGHGGHGGHRA